MASPLPSEIRPVLRLTQRSDVEMNRILERTARDIRRRIEQLPVGVGGQVRAAQLRLALQQITARQTEMWSGPVTTSVQRSRKAAAEAAERATDTLTSVVYGSVAEPVAQSLTRGFRASAQSAIDNDVARVPRALSSRVYRNASLANGAVEATIRSGLISGLSSREMAKSVYQYISPTTPGGASYAANRLARTEIANSFHQRQIQGGQRPGVLGTKWNLSGSHRRPDACNAYADHGLYQARDVPGKPHPNCFCYLTYDTMTPDQFADALAKGKFDDQLGLKQIQVIEDNPALAGKSLIDHKTHGHASTPKARALCRQNGGITERGWPPKTTVGHPPVPEVMPKEVKVPVKEVPIPKVPPKPPIVPVTRLSGKEAIDSVPVSVAPGPNKIPSGYQLNDWKKTNKAFQDYQGVGFTGTNTYLNHPATWIVDQKGTANVVNRIRLMDAAIDKSVLPNAVTVHRGVADLEKVLGRSANGDLSGVEWTQGSHVSTSVRERVAKNFADPGELKGAVLEIRVPAGTKGIKLSHLDDQGEILLQRGLRHRIIEDKGMVNGKRHLVIEVSEPQDLFTLPNVKAPRIVKPKTTPQPKPVSRESVISNQIDVDLAQGVTRESTIRALNATEQKVGVEVARVRSIKDYDPAEFTGRFTVMEQKNVFAACNNGDIRLSAHLHERRDSIRGNNRSGWFIESKTDIDELERIVAHEVGHALTTGGHLSRSQFRRIADELGDIMGTGPINMFSLFDDVGWRTWLDTYPNRKNMARMWGQYATTNMRELLAEVWSVYSLDSGVTGPIARLGKLIEELVAGGT